MDELKIFNDAFNKGYLLQKSDPELAKKVVSGFTDRAHPYAEGFAYGVTEWQREQGQKIEQFLDDEKERQKETWRESRERGLSNERDLEL